MILAVGEPTWLASSRDDEKAMKHTVLSAPVRSRMPLLWLVLLPGISLNGEIGHADDRTPIAECLQELTAEHDGKQSHRRAVQGVVTWVATNKLGLLMEDDSGGIYVNLTSARWAESARGRKPLSRQIQPGQLVDVCGELTAGGYSPQIIPLEVKIQGTAPLPGPQPFHPERFFSGADNGRRIRAEGIVQRIESSFVGQKIHLAYRGRRYTATLPGSAAGIPDGWVDGTVALTGAATAMFNTRGELLEPRLRLLGATDVTLVRPAPYAAWDAPLRPLAAIARYQPAPPSGHRIRTRGTVTLCVPGSHLYLQRGLAGLRVETVGEEVFSAGDELEVTGFVVAENPVAKLVAADTKRLSQGNMIPAVTVTPRQILQINGESAYSGQLARPGDYHNALVRFAARVIVVSATERGGEIMLDADGVGVTLVCEPAIFADVQSVSSGTAIQITGIVRSIGDGERPPVFLGAPPPSARLTVLLPTPDDLVVLQLPSWWTTRRLGMALGLVGGVALAAMAWGLSLRRQVRRQLAVIESGLLASATVEERQRIAREFHDTLEQDLAGITLQLDAAADRTADAESKQVFEEQRGQLARVRAETHDFLWDLRDPTRQEGPLAAAIEAQVAALQPLTDTPLFTEVAAELPPVSSLVRHHLLRIIREATTNAIGHAKATEILIRVDRDGGGVVCDVIDNGKGFSPEAVQSVPGHFGLRGIHERARRIGAAVNVLTQPGHGTRVSLRVPQASSA